MKKGILTLSCLSLLFLFAFKLTEITPIAIGSAMPKADVKMKEVMSGKEITLAQAKKENGLLVIFSCNTCPYVIKHQNIMIEEGKHAEASKIGCIVVNSNEGKRDGDDSYDAMKKYAKEQGYTMPYTVDKNSELADAFGATRTPEVYLFDKNLKLVYHGAYTDDSDPVNATKFFLRDAMNELKDGKVITITSAKSVGCTIKRAAKN